MYTYSFEKLEVWQNARFLVKDIYLMTQAFPENEKFGITSQMRRASTSITANIVEGLSRKTKKDKLRFLNMSFSTCVEVVNFLILSFDLGLINENVYLDLREKTEKISNQLNSLYKSIDKQINN